MINPLCSYFDNPTILEESKNNIVGYDIFSRLLRDRIIFLGEEIDDTIANVVIAQLLYLDHISNDPIHLYINSPGGIITAGFGIYDTINCIKSPVYTYCVGQSASMAAILLAAGAKGHRYALSHSRIMIHQPLGGTSGQSSDIQIAAREIERMKNEVVDILALSTNQPSDKIEKDIDRDYWMTSAQAKEYGLIDYIL